MRKKKKNFKLIFALIVIASAVVFVMFDKRFEQNPPKIIIKKDYPQWNMLSNIEISIDDESGLKSYEVVFFDGKNKHILASFNKDSNRTITHFNFNVTNTDDIDPFGDFSNAYLQVSAIDNSKWNLMQGNKAIKKINFKIDTQPPKAMVLASSKYLKRGGSALAVVKVQDENLVDSYVLVNNERFELYPYKKEGYYLCFMAWDVDIEHFSGARLIAIDKAGNKVSRKIPLWVGEFVYRKRNIKIDDYFIEQVSTVVLENSREVVPNTNKEIFLKQNKYLRAKNTKTLKNIIRKLSDKTLKNKFSLKTFKRLKGSTKVSHFADYRTYYYKKRKIDKEWHLGIDWVARPRTRIATSNNGVVIFNEYLGINGNTVLIDHSFGITSLYAHLSVSNVEVGDEVRAGSKIGNTGSTGASFGDHLHFSMLVQGILVDPKEWLDRNWLKGNVYNVLKKAKRLMNDK